MKQWITALGTILITTSSGCVINSTQSEPPPGNDAPDAQEGVTGKALAMRFGDWTIPNFHPWDFGVGVQVPQEPDSLVLFFSDVLQACGQPVLNGAADPSPCNPGMGSTQIILMIPPDLNRPGLIDLADTRIAAHESVWVPSCGGGSIATPGFRGTLEIVSSDPTSLSVKLQVGEPLPLWVNEHEVESPLLDGDYTVQRCGQAPPVAPPLSAIAVQGANLPALPGKPPPDPAALYLFMGTAVETAADACSDPWSSIDCTQTWRATLSLPPALQQPGIINLSDPAIGARYSLSREHFTCSASDLIGGTMPNGTIEILSIDASGVSFKLYGSHIDASSFNGDGLYAASICP